MGPASHETNTVQVEIEHTTAETASSSLPSIGIRLGTVAVVLSASLAVQHNANPNQQPDLLLPLVLADIPAKVYQLPEPQKQPDVNHKASPKIARAVLEKHVSIKPQPKKPLKEIKAHTAANTERSIPETSEHDLISNSTNTANPKERVTLTNDTHEELKKKTCTSLRRRSKDVYVGMACEEDGAMSEVVFSNTLEKGWVYSAVYVGGIYKCAFVRPGVLPEMPHRPKVVAECEGYYEDFVNERYVFFNKYNCKELRPGLEGCRSGTPPRGVTNTRPEDVVLYGNYATDDPSPFNVLGTGGGGFSMELPNKIKAAISYRVEVKPGSEEGKAIIVRDTNDTPTLDWGFTLSKHVSDSDRRGGTPTKIASLVLSK